MAKRFAIRAAAPGDYQKVEDLANEVRDALMAALPMDSKKGRLESSLIVYGLLVVAAELTSQCPQDRRGLAIETFQQFFAEVVNDFAVTREG